MNYTIDPSTFALYLQFPVSRTYGTPVEILLYGILLVLLGIAAQLLYSRTGPGRWVLLVVTSVMAALATLQLVIHVYSAALAFQIFELAVQEDFNSATALRANHRFILGYIYAYEEDYLGSTHFNSRIACLMSGVTNVLLMMLTGTLTSGFIQPVAGLQCSKPDGYGGSGERPPSYPNLPGFTGTTRLLLSCALSSIPVILPTTSNDERLESGAFYCVSVLIYVAAGSVPNPDRNLLPVTVIFGAALPMIVNIAPTLLIVRVEQGHSVGEGGTVERHERHILVEHPRSLDAPTPTHPFVIDIHAGDSTPDRKARGTEQNRRAGVIMDLALGSRPSPVLAAFENSSIHNIPRTQTELKSKQEKVESEQVAETVGINRMFALALIVMP
ncbi:hypothetical protein C8R43DRAFT_1208790 [Mycena crocata]|nr:hypothetical protein C8R43DRAFT_1208790 [Mycena crocata]